jgi:hypothetical protein
LTISETVRDQLCDLPFIRSDAVTVLHLGPGQVENVAAPMVGERKPSLILVGGAPHKRNELAARLLAEIKQVRESYHVTAVSVSATTKAILRETFSARQLTILDNATRDDLVRAYGQSQTYIALTTSEGFGFPYVEAAYLGCDVVAPRQALTIEVLGDDAALLESSDPSPNDLWEAIGAWDRGRVERLQTRAMARSWNRTAAEVTLVARRIAQGSR